jgi:hypothetical protein
LGSAEEPRPTQFLHRTAVLDKAQSKGRISKCTAFVTVTILWNEELNCSEVIVLHEYIPFSNSGLQI